MVMKKSRVFLAVSSVLWGIIVLLAVWAFPKLWFIWAIAGAALWAAGFWHFQTITYELSNENIRITSGFLFKRERVLPKKEILMTARFALAGRLLFTVVYFSGGRVILFADLPQ